ncbi:MAG TPA: hypothetical protein VGN72_10625 [Tepidisphaeraceae bacterium]|jgi:hypothetical protein|nr:hypothetical protein [Tepidisphaeraceae bacterium]
MSYLDPTDPSAMSVEDRLREVASILARGVLRLHLRGALGPDSHSNLPLIPHSDPAPDRLDVSAGMQHMGHRG